jgi:hypothetical protein
MNAHPAAAGRASRTRVIVLSLAVLLAAAAPFAAAAAEPSPDAGAMPSPEVVAPDGETLCESADDLRLIVGFLSETSISEDGVIPVVVGVIAGLSEARTLLGLVDETYRPLVENLITSLEALGTTIDELGEAATLGAEIASVGEAITDVGEAMDALGVQLRDPCPVEEPAASAVPVESEG